MERQERERESGVHFVKNKAALNSTICWFFEDTSKCCKCVFCTFNLDVAPILLGLAFLVGVKMEKEKIRESMSLN